MEGHKLSEFFPEYNYMLYTYDMGDNWEHEIQLVRVIENYDKESPCLLEASGQTPPEDVGGVGGFLNFREIMLNPSHPDYEEMKDGRRFGQLSLAIGKAVQGQFMFKWIRLKVTRDKAQSKMGKRRRTFI